MDLINNPKYKEELKKIQNIDIHHPSYPAFKKMVMDMADVINFAVVEMLKKESRYFSN
tara:strand:- start:250 stop:423 length:174 start_codon:yes stop_codon:yes gene_type:complete